ncbi:tartan protein, putative [Pediculus humanus corporis]|uniref:Tartan protein, putative n=1 Tax=Pediculus humanus subsp. corporis TaxID=121224 RepID=E0VEL8_PEDHC|nr:tartan protein, putative [Pediculus humanus corporis]EEB11824.1 tartan protein, putative [Pediculus humanus corporis]
MLKSEDPVLSHKGKYISRLNHNSKKVETIRLSFLFRTMIQFHLFELIYMAVFLSSAAQALAFCPNGCICDDDTLVVSCKEANLDVIPITLNPSIQRLVLKNNRIKTVDAAFQFYGELQYVDLAYNHLVSIPMKSFEAQKKLFELHLNHNKISSINNQTFVGLKNLGVLSLRENFLEELSSNLFSSLPSLQELDLGVNSISVVDPSAFSGLSSLKILYLDDNQLRSIPTGSFSLLGNLAELHIGLNAFTSLSDGAFTGLTKLYKLDLVSAGLVNISEGAFKKLTGLRSLGLADNRLGSIPTRQLKMMTRLEELSLGQNEFRILESNAFLGLSNLRRLDISGAPHLEKVEKDAFRDNLNLETLVLSSNKRLSQIEEGALAGLPNLKNLVLRDNAFSSFSESLVSWLELHEIDIAENPIECRCSLLWLKELLIKKNISQILCASPSHLKDRRLSTLTSDDMGCSYSDTRQQAIIGAVCCIAAVILALIVFFLYRYRKSVQDVLKEYKWNNRAISRKEHEYQKTFSDDDFIVRAAQQPTLKPIPVTEL